MIGRAEVSQWRSAGGVKREASEALMQRAMPALPPQR